LRGVDSRLRGNDRPDDLGGDVFDGHVDSRLRGNDRRLVVM